MTDLAALGDLYLGGEPGADLSRAGPACALLTSAIGNPEDASLRIAHLFWKTFIDSPALLLTLSQENLGVESVTRGKALVVYHGPSNRPRYDLLILDPQFSRPAPTAIKQVYAPTALPGAEPKSYFVPNWDVIAEVAAVQRFGLLVAKGPTPEDDSFGGSGILVGPMLGPQPFLPGSSQAFLDGQQYFAQLTARCPTPAWRASAAQNPMATKQRIGCISTAGAFFGSGAYSDAVATVGVLAQDRRGNVGVTTALHAITPMMQSVQAAPYGSLALATRSLQPPPSRIIVEELTGQVLDYNAIQDSCFIKLPIEAFDLDVIGPLTDRGPGAQECAVFEGIASGSVSTRIVASDLGIPFWIHKDKQLCVYTPPVTMQGDSGAALLTMQDDSGAAQRQVIGFAHQRVGTEYFAYSDWIWANSVFIVHGLRGC